MERNVFQVPEGRDQQRLHVSKPPHLAQDDVVKQLLQTDDRAEREPQAEGKANPPSQSDGRTESPPKYRPKLVEEVQRFVKTAPGVEETPEREWKAQRTFSFSSSFLSTCLGFVLPVFLHFSRSYQLVRASLSTLTHFSLFSLSSFLLLFGLSSCLPFTSSPLFAAYRFSSSTLPFLS